MVSFSFMQIGQMPSPPCCRPKSSGLAIMRLSSVCATFIYHLLAAAAAGSNGRGQPPASPGIFGVALQDSIKYANVAISLTDEEGKSFIYGYVPIVIAKCGVFLKEKGQFICLLDIHDPVGWWCLC